jgi:hypothetical protein
MRGQSSQPATDGGSSRTVISPRCVLNVFLLFLSIFGGDES